MKEFLLELFSEEIPARMQSNALDHLKNSLLKAIEAHALAYSSVQSFVTPRRLTVVIQGLPEKQADLTEEKKGPKTSAPKEAVAGFCKANNLTEQDLTIRPTDKGEFFFAVIDQKGEKTSEILKKIILEILNKFAWSKSMRWGEGKTKWIRPLHAIVCLLGEEVIDLEFAGIKSGNYTFGHRFLAPDRFTVKNSANYQSQLAAQFVILDKEERQKIILNQAQTLAAQKQLIFKEDAKLLDEVSGLVEYPKVLIGEIDHQFIKLPPEVLVSSMGKHQKYFALYDQDGSLAPYFIMVSNMQTADNGVVVVNGNERVLRARLSDAAFFFEQDRKVSLAARVEKLSSRIFYTHLGTDQERVKRITSLSAVIAEKIHAQIDLVKRAGLLCKADLTTGMVGEFPELQGLMGKYYAEYEGEDKEVCQAIAEHYAPQGPNDLCPHNPVSVAVALADKIDLLNGFWLIDLKPTGSKDPLALRRACLGVIRLILENDLRFSLNEIFTVSQELYLAEGYEKIQALLKSKGQDYAAQQRRDLINFFIERLKVYLKDQGVSHDLIAAAEQGKEDDLVKLINKIKALESFLTTEDGINLLTAFRRASNIVKIETKKTQTSYDAMPDQALFIQEEEQKLFDHLLKVMDEADKKLDKEEFASAMTLLADLRMPVDNFFNKVTVNCDDKHHRVNRLKLLAYIEKVISKVADFSKIETKDD